MSANLLATQRIFKGVPMDKVQVLYDAGSTLSLQADQIVVEEGQDPENIYFILSGEADVLIPDAENADVEKPVNTLIAGECIGEYGFVDGRPASATVRTITDTRLFELPITLLRDNLQKDPDLQRRVYENLLDSLVERLRTNNIIIDLLRYQE